MAEEKLQGLLNLPQQAQRFITSPTAFLGLLGQNPLPRESGFAAGATGLPPTEMSVLDPNQAPYMQGYGQGEPVGYAGMALPFAAPAAVATGRALAPKAGLLAENYMQRMGGLMPLEAYHGTPHNIQGKFDINKVGTGEGAQAYGHGMYFAQARGTGEQYKYMLSKPEFSKTNEGIELRGELPRMLNESYDELVAKNGIQQTNYGDVTDIVGQRLDRQMKDALKANDMDWYNKTADMKLDLARFRENPPPNTGNLYKVDIPDKDIANMLDYDKPLSQQPKSVQKALAKIDSDLYSKKGNDYDPQETGQMIYQRLSQIDMNKNGPFTGASRNVSNLLNSYGIKGIRYKDAMSRGVDEGTSNFVVFDPSTVKILEKNDKKIEGLLD